MVQSLNMLPRFLYWQFSKEHLILPLAIYHIPILHHQYLLTKTTIHKLICDNLNVRCASAHQSQTGLSKAVNAAETTATNGLMLHVYCTERVSQLVSVIQELQHHRFLLFCATGFGATEICRIRLHVMKIVVNNLNRVLLLMCLACF